MFCFYSRAGEEDGVGWGGERLGGIKQVGILKGLQTGKR